MNSTTKYILFGALGVAAVLLLSTDKAKELREDLQDSAMKNAKKWKNKLNQIGSSTSDTITDLKEMLASEIEGLSDDARTRIESILDGAEKSTGKAKKNLSKQLS